MQNPDGWIRLDIDGSPANITMVLPDTPEMLDVVIYVLEKRLEAMRKQGGSGP